MWCETVHNLFAPVFSTCHPSRRGVDVDVDVNEELTRSDKVELIEGTHPSKSPQSPRPCAFQSWASTEYYRARSTAIASFR